MCGNKCDLETSRVVSTQEGVEFADSVGWPFFETSAKLNINVSEAIHELIRRTPRLRGKEYKVWNDLIVLTANAIQIVYI